MGIIAYRGGDLPAAGGLFRRALVGFTRCRDPRGCAIAVEHLAGVAGAPGQWERAGRLLGASEMLFDLSSQVPFPPFQIEPEATAMACRAGLGEKAFAAAVAAGRAMTVERAFQYALESDEPRGRARGEAE